VMPKGGFNSLSRNNWNAKWWQVQRVDIRGQEYLEIRIKLVISRYIFRKWLQNLIRMQLCFWNLHQLMFLIFFYSSRKKFTSFLAILLENFQNLFRVPNSIWLDWTPSTHFSSSCERTQQQLKESHFLHDFLCESGP
jgi:hypothetical protein